eukprot:3842343-Prorocentrum_lima.AAC.1
MTSSLVGSEMCIRDSACTMHFCGGAEDVDGMRLVTQRQSRHPVGHGAVSYTHLTLPTICSV